MIDEQSGRGGNLTFRTGEERKELTGFQHPGGDFIFELSDGTEFMRIAADGAVTIRGERVAQNKDVFAAFVKWINHSEVMRVTK
jgi:hypothetical protein